MVHNIVIKKINAEIINQQLVGLAQYKDWKQWETASLALSKGNKIHVQQTH